MILMVDESDREKQDIFIIKGEGVEVMEVETCRESYRDDVNGVD